MTTAGTPSLNRPLPDRTEAEARIEMALEYARAGIRVTEETAYLSSAKAHGYKLTLEKVISILEKGA